MLNLEKGNNLPH